MRWEGVCTVSFPVVKGSELKEKPLKGLVGGMEVWV